MRFVTFFFVAALLGFFPTKGESACWDFRKTCEYLKNVTAIHILVEDLPGAIKNAGVSKISLWNQTAGALRAQLPQVLVSNKKGILIPYLYISANSLPVSENQDHSNHHALHIKISIEYFGKLSENDPVPSLRGRGMMTTLWSAEQLSITSATNLKAEISRILKKTIGQIADDWRGANAG